MYIFNTFSLPSSHSQALRYSLHAFPLYSSYPSLSFSPDQLLLSSPNGTGTSFLSPSESSVPAPAPFRWTAAAASLLLPRGEIFHPQDTWISHPTAPRQVLRPRSPVFASCTTHASPPGSFPQASKNSLTLSQKGHSLCLHSLPTSFKKVVCMLCVLTRSPPLQPASSPTIPIKLLCSYYCKSYLHLPSMYLASFPLLSL